MLGLMLAALLSPSAAPPGPGPLAARYLYAGDLLAGEKALVARLKEEPADDEARFGLGVIRFLRGVERAAASVHAHGPTKNASLLFTLFGLRLDTSAIKPVAKPKRMTYAALRNIVQAFVEDVNGAEKTLAGVKDAKVKLPLFVGRIQVDITGRGERLRAVSLLTGDQREAAKGLLITFDRSDVCWLRGYCHLIAAIGEVFLSLDTEDIYTTVAHLLFADVDTPEVARLASGTSLVVPGVGVMPADIFLDLVNLPVSEPARLKKALAHLESAVAQAKEMWTHILAETDDDHEWVPNPRQRSVVPVRVSAEMIQAWRAVLDDLELILSGKRLVPFWAGKTTHGVNVRKVFTSPPKRLRLWAWVHGPAAGPYLEKGPVTDLSRGERLERLERVFGGFFGFLGFAAWFN
jgi:hypothetical protein